jgi:hypothetical protein
MLVIFLVIEFRNILNFELWPVYKYLKPVFESHLLE